MVHNYFTSVNFNVSYNSIENHQINGRNIKIEVDGKIIQFSKRSKFKDKGMHILKYNINRHLSNMSLFYVNRSNIITIDILILILKILLIWQEYFVDVNV